MNDDMLKSLKESRSWCTGGDEQDIEARCASYYLNNTGTYCD